MNQRKGESERKRVCVLEVVVEQPAPLQPVPLQPVEGGPLAAEEEEDKEKDTARQDEAPMHLGREGCCGYWALEMVVLCVRVCVQVAVAVCMHVGESVVGGWCLEACMCVCVC